MREPQPPAEEPRKLGEQKTQTEKEKTTKNEMWGNNLNEKQISGN